MKLLRLQGEPELAQFLHIGQTTLLEPKSSPTITKPCVKNVNINRHRTYL